MTHGWTTRIARRPLLAGILGLFGVGLAGGLVYEGPHLLGRRYPRTKFDDLLDQLPDRESAARLGRAAVAKTKSFDAKTAAETLRAGPGKGSVDQAISLDIVEGRLATVQGWVLPASLVEVASIAASVQQPA